MTRPKKIDKLRARAFIILGKVTALGIAERSLVQKLMDSGATSLEAAKIVQELIEEKRIKRVTMGYIAVVAQ